MPVVDVFIHSVKIEMPKEQAKQLLEEIHNSVGLPNEQSKSKATLLQRIGLALENEFYNGVEK